MDETEQKALQKKLVAENDVSRCILINGRYKMFYNIRPKSSDLFAPIDYDSRMFGLSYDPKKHILLNPQLTLKRGWLDRGVR